jgi:hypothetical protein
MAIQLLTKVVLSTTNFEESATFLWMSEACVKLG